MDNFTAKRTYVREITKILHQINDIERLVKIYAVVKTHLEMQNEKGGVQ